MEHWQKSLTNSIGSIEDLAKFFPFDMKPLEAVAACYPLRITPHYLGLITETGDPIWKQCIPDVRELEDDGQSEDPLNEENLSPVPGLIHRYPDRVVLLTSDSCPVYCRFCMRKRRVGRISCSWLCMDDVIHYIRSHKSIRDVILSGGEPLMLDDDRLEEIIARLKSIPHVEIIRLGTRAPVTLPERVTINLCRMLRRYQPLYVNTHFNHPKEITSESARACARLADAGIQLGNQTVLLKGVNDNVQVMRMLMQQLLTIRVRPYYIHQMDLVKGTSHFRTSVSCGLQIMEGLRGHTSGLAVPSYMIDLPGGKGKVPILPENMKQVGETLLLRNYKGEIIEYYDVVKGER